MQKNKISIDIRKQLILLIKTSSQIEFVHTEKLFDIEILSNDL